MEICVYIPVYVILKSFNVKLILGIIKDYGWGNYAIYRFHLPNLIDSSRILEIWSLLSILN